MTPHLYTILDAVSWLNDHTSGKRWTYSRVWAAVKAKDLPHVEIGGRVYVGDLDGWLVRRLAESTEKPVEQAEPVSTYTGPRRFGTPEREASGNAASKEWREWYRRQSESAK